jgi:hypothetical protein
MAVEMNQDRKISLELEKQKASDFQAQFHRLLAFVHRLAGAVAKGTQKFILSMQLPLAHRPTVIGNASPADVTERIC